MLDIFSGLRLVIKRRPINIDNTIFRFHWFLTSTILVSFSLIITARQYVGQPIECHSIDKIPETLLNSYCWVQSTFTVPQACNQRVGTDVPYPCIDNSRGREIKMFAYYQWVGIVLFIQGILFHLPYYLWKLWEAGLIRAITSGLRVAVLSDIERCKKKDIVIEYLHEHLGCHRPYALKYFLCELCCLLNLLLQLWATDKFFDGRFFNYGLDVLRYSASGGQTSSSKANFTQPTIIDPMTFIFPRITKCTYYDFGSSGDIQKHDAICLLPLNIVNEKIYIALWFWFLVLALLTSVVVIFRFFILAFKGVRAKFLISRCKLSSKSDLQIICQRGDVGDWFLFYMMASNLDPLIMREVVAAIAERLEIRTEKEREAMGLIGDKEPLTSFSSLSLRETCRSCSRRNLVLIKKETHDEDNNNPTTISNNSPHRCPRRGSLGSVKPLSFGRLLRNRLNLRGLLRGPSKLFSLDDSMAPSSSSSGSQRRRLKRLNSWQGDHHNHHRSHNPFKGGQQQDAGMATLENGATGFTSFTTQSRGFLDPEKSTNGGSIETTTTTTFNQSSRHDFGNLMILATSNNIHQKQPLQQIIPEMGIRMRSNKSADATRMRYQFNYQLHDSGIINDNNDLPSPMSTEIVEASAPPASPSANGLKMAASPLAAVTNSQAADHHRPC